MAKIDSTRLRDDSHDEGSQKGALETIEGRLATPGTLEVPISYRNTVIGVLVIEDDRNSGNWEDEEMLMVKTVSDQLAVAISHARLFRQVQTQAMTDALTGLYNHGYFQERLDRETKLADRNNDQVSLILLDLDHLKRINDTHGHRTGDAALCHVASIMQSTVREVDVCARYGGEEFVVILPQCDRQSAIEVAERLRQSIASSPLSKSEQVTASTRPCRTASRTRACCSLRSRSCRGRKTLQQPRPKDSLSRRFGTPRERSTSSGPPSTDVPRHLSRGRRRSGRWRGAGRSAPDPGEPL